MKVAINNILNEVEIEFDGEIQKQGFADEELNSFVLLDEHFSDPINHLMHQMNVVLTFLLRPQLQQNLDLVRPL